ncbi:MAG TPA: pyridoxamine 5'-phosphate oxidase family protein [Acidimicrobiia bacterium]|nr:pyridoxamine 5'-phosphate oxidase family protein [Acidimicrobiia bacterium]
MAKLREALDERLVEFIHRQKVFFVATSPGKHEGHVNLSPKGVDGTFSVIDERTVAYLDIVGSGIETVAHLKNDGRIVVMFCAFDGPPKVLRLHGRGTVILPGEAGWEELMARFPPQPGTRCVIRIDVERISDSCGFGVPLMSYQGERGQLADWVNHKTDEQMAEYKATKNARSIDGLPGLPVTAE